MDIKVLHKSSTFSSFTSSGHKIGSWFATFGDRRRKNSMKASKSLTLGKEVASSVEGVLQSCTQALIILFYCHIPFPFITVITFIVMELPDPVDFSL